MKNLFKINSQDGSVFVSDSGTNDTLLKTNMEPKHDGLEEGIPIKTSYKMGPQPVISRVITPLEGVITPVTHFLSHS